MWAEMSGTIGPHPERADTRVRPYTIPWIDYLYVGILIFYVLAGARLVPFHGDESTILYMSRDWFKSPSALAYGAFPPGSGEAMDQELRLLNGVVSKDSYGGVFSL